ncbi:uncharacterized protein [Dermacentor andersoni]|uniref:uncharacterized protein isoform X2 n=1 Tax=Dermacentor andersoni TaxID=34620 RepID=UPI002416306A|nr:uncharacterized protein LOC126523442 isoform X2 [Dermacentor andersoni]
MSRQRTSAAINPDTQRAQRRLVSLRDSNCLQQLAHAIVALLVSRASVDLWTFDMQASSGGSSVCLYALLLSGAFSKVRADGNEPDLYFKISKSCNGSEVPGQPYLFHLAMAEGDEIPLEMKAAFFDDTCQPPGPAGSSSVYLREYEVFQVAFVGTDGYYTQVDVGPYGHYLVTLGNIAGSTLKMDLTLSYATNVDRYRSTWRASVRIPVAYLPPGVATLNAWARHGRPSARRELALYPPPPGSPCKLDSTAVKTFGELEIKRICAKYEPKKLSHTWKRAFEDYYWASSSTARPATALLVVCLLALGVRRLK